MQATIQRIRVIEHLAEVLVAKYGHAEEIPACKVNDELGKLFPHSSWCEIVDMACEVYDAAYELKK